LTLTVLLPTVAQPLKLDSWL